MNSQLFFLLQTRDGKQNSHILQALQAIHIVHLKTYMACVAWGGIGHQAIHIVHLKTYMVCVAWGGIGHQAIHIVHLKAYMARVAWGGIGHQAIHIVHLKAYMACVAWGGIGHQELRVKSLVWNDREATPVYRRPPFHRGSWTVWPDSVISSPGPGPGISDGELF